MVLKYWFFFLFIYKKIDFFYTVAKNSNLLEYYIIIL